ncbi:uncharacterized protein B0I36DRAFT_27689 [Microdochium trichocladiopsis]|uniref:Uncharacterized protein n=1 Tax=Microdochium trichocladiopsis TaxID=1682393 RepID=A0A9P8XW41_9PEZI|nr:uncharacterized protein B0I36DRAFT_27689 [Microdochium trichocladiopsis]KAH7020991.1 hypothetical protein B0I36DRAFT_27689 [Microdochium trichocladiopsis]
MAAGCWRGGSGGRPVGGGDGWATVRYLYQGIAGWQVLDLFFWPIDDGGARSSGEQGLAGVCRPLSWPGRAKKYRVKPGPRTAGTASPGQSDAGIAPLRGVSQGRSGGSQGSQTDTARTGKKNLPPHPTRAGRCRRPRRLGKPRTPCAAQPRRSPLPHPSKPNLTGLHYDKCLAHQRKHVSKYARGCPDSQPLLRRGPGLCATFQSRGRRHCRLCSAVPRLRPETGE